MALSRIRVTIIVGTRPEVIKLAPLARALNESDWAELTVLSSGQHTDLFQDAARSFGFESQITLDLGLQSRSLAELGSGLLHQISEKLESDRPDLVLVHGDTATALYGSLAAFYLGIPVAHVEAGLRTGNLALPFPEESNRRLIGAIATYHLAPTKSAARNLQREGVESQSILISGNTIVDAVRMIHSRHISDPNWTRANMSSLLEGPLSDVGDGKLALVTLHRRENQDSLIADYLKALFSAAVEHPDWQFVYPVHPSPAVVRVTQEIGAPPPNFNMVPPLDYLSFLHLLSKASLVVSDSGGIQEECAVFRVPILICRDVTERPEVLDSGFGQLVGGSAAALEQMLSTFLTPGSKASGWMNDTPAVPDLTGEFGDGHSSELISEWLRQQLVSASS